MRRRRARGAYMTERVGYAVSGGVRGKQAVVCWCDAVGASMQKGMWGWREDEGEQSLSLQDDALCALCMCSGEHCCHAVESCAVSQAQRLSPHTSSTS